jgi:hypothetical protein
VFVFFSAGGSEVACFFFFGMCCSAQARQHGWSKIGAQDPAACVCVAAGGPCRAASSTIAFHSSRGSACLAAHSNQGVDSRKSL